MKNKLKIGFISLGCPKNQIDTEHMLHLVSEAGYEIVSEDINADIVIVNTCAFIESAKKESIDSILDVAWLKENRNLKAIIVTGCMAERYQEQIYSELPEVDALLGVGSCGDIVKAIESVAKGKKYSAFAEKNSSELGGGRILTTPSYTAYLKIAEGCDNCCTYCAIPMIRGHFRSRKMEDIVEEAKSLEESGVKEIILIAQDTTRYGLDLYGEYKLPDLINKICEATNIPWIRLLYCYPDKITDELVTALRDNDRLLKYIDLPVQHISDNVLKRMNRHGGSETIFNAVKKLRDNVPGIIIRSTAIVGFPGETKEDFGKLCAFVKEARFDRFGVFTYSREENTPAYDMDDQIEESIKQDRYDILMSEQLSIIEEKNEKNIGRIITVLCEGFDPVAETFYGRSEADAPDIDGKVYFTAGERIPAGSFVKIKITESLDYDLIGEFTGKIQ